MRLKGLSTSRLDKRLAGYTLLGAAAFTVTGIAHADDVTYVPVGQSFDAVSGPSSYGLNLSGGALADVTISATFGSVPSPNAEVAASVNNGAQIITSDGAAALVYRSLIDPSASGWGTGGKMVESDYPVPFPVGNWPDDGGAAYLGFYYVGTDGDHAGWMNISTTWTGSDAAFTVNSYAFDTTPNEAIFAGQDDPNPIPSSVPEPSTLSLLAMGSAGLLELRRRRRANA
ncbi:MAG TPA: PEP-CTERM sorting domain-containing protein [Acidobacteriaceae bacterium]|nr:PEP-CTERM sorting domain-containing protein [Acidobacteriaceae bacterium]